MVGDTIYNRFFAVDTTSGGGCVFGAQCGNVPFEVRKFNTARMVLAR